MHLGTTEATSVASIPAVRPAAARLALTLCAFGLLVACQAAEPDSATAAPAQVDPYPAQTEAQDAPATPEPSPDAATETQQALRASLQLLAAAAPPAWAQFETIDALAPQLPAGGIGMYRKGVRSTITLHGFEATPLPDGAVGADAGVRAGNAGESSLTLAGDDAAVHVLAVRKFVAQTDYGHMLRQQLNAGDVLVRRDGTCDDPTQHAADAVIGYWLMLDGAALPLSVSASVEDGGRQGPGYTDFEFRRGSASVELPDCPR